MDTDLKMIPFAKIKNLKNGKPYPVAHTHIAHIRENPLPPPPRSAVSKLLLILDDILARRVWIRKVTTSSL